jgi:hypothetical protein
MQATALKQDSTPLRLDTAPLANASSAWAHLPYVADNVITAVSDDLRRGRLQRFVDSRRKAVATLLLMGIEKQWTNKSELRRALVGRDSATRVHCLAGDMFDQMCAWTKGEFLSQITDTTDDINLRFELALEDDMNFPDTQNLVVSGPDEGCIMFAYDLLALPKPVSEAVQRAIFLLSNKYCDVTYPEMAREMALDWFEFGFVYEDLQDLRIHDDPESSLEHIRDHHPNWIEWEHIQTPDDVQRLLSKAAELYDETFSLQKFERKAKAVAEAQDLLRIAHGWQNDKPQLYGNPWASFVQHTAQVVLRFERAREELPSLDTDQLFAEYDEMEVPMSEGIVLSFGQGYMYDFAQGCYENIMNAGTTGCHKFRLVPEHASHILWHLETMAVSYGLLWHGIECNDLVGKEMGRNVLT